ncbi:hypothetical protein KSD_72600 [Ktedonobacter sp. SOSP1-85]|nr:hypothetical protein KSD_72600 [Ktedonobacter sp. SOSP1-85]
MGCSVFLSYALEDQSLSHALIKSLAVLHYTYPLSIWSRNDLVPGTDTHTQCMNQLMAADLILLLISPDFFSYDHSHFEMQEALKQYAQGKAVIVPILARPVVWQDTPLGAFHPLPTNGKPITQWPTRDAAFNNITQGIKALLQDQNKKKEQSWEGWHHSQSNGAQTGLAPGQQENIAPLYNLPFPRNPFFTGREEILSAIRHTLLQEQTTAVGQPSAVSGLGGIGKTQIALEYAYRHRQHYRSIFWVQADTPEHLYTSMQRLAHQLNRPFSNEEDQHASIHVVKRWLETHNGWLLIIDNADILTSLDNMLPQNHHGHILITTRESTTGMMSHLFKVDTMNIKEATHLLLRRAKYLQSGELLESIPEAEQKIAREIVSEMGGLPLAIDQAGAYIEETHCSLSRYLDLFHAHQIQLLKRRGKHQKQHPNSVATTFSLAFAKVREMHPLATDVLKFCASFAPFAIPINFFEQKVKDLNSPLFDVFANPLDLEEAISTLHSFSLIQRDGRENTLEMHRLVQAVIRDEMPESEQMQWAERVVTAIGTHILAKNNKINKIFDKFTILHSFEAATHILEWNFARIEAIPVLYIAGHQSIYLAGFHQATSFFSKGLSICDEILGDTHLLSVQMLTGLAITYKRGRNHEQAISLYERALQVGPKIFGEKSLDFAEILMSLAGLYKDREEYEKAGQLYEQVHTICNVVEHEKVLEKDDLALLINIYTNVGNFFLRQHKTTEAEPYLKQALHLHQELFAHKDILYAFIVSNLAEFSRLQGKTAEAIAQHEEALDLRKKLIGEKHPDIAESLYNLGTLYEDENRDVEAERYYKQALTIYEKALGSQHLTPTLVKKVLASFYNCQKRYEEAKPLFQSALATYETILGEKHAKTMQVLLDLGYLYEQQGKHEEAIRVYEKGLAANGKDWDLEHEQTQQFLSCLLRLSTKQDEEDTLKKLENTLLILEKIMGPNPSQLGSRWSSLGIEYSQKGDFLQAEKCTQKALTLFEQIPEGYQRERVSCISNLGTFCSKQWDYKKAENYYKKAIKMLQHLEYPGKLHDMAKTLHGMGTLYRNMERYTHAESLYLQAIDIWEQLAEPDYQNMADAYHGLGSIAFIQNNYADAEAFFQKDHDLCQEKLGSDHPDTLQSIMALGILSMHQRKRAQGAILLQKAVKGYEKVLGKDHPNTVQSRTICTRLLSQEQ